MFDEDYQRMEFFSAVEEDVPEEVLAGLNHGPLTCQPRFLLYCEGEKKDEIHGADYTALERAISRHIPTLDDWLFDMIIVQKFLDTSFDRINSPPFTVDNFLLFKLVVVCYQNI